MMMTTLRGSAGVENLWEVSAEVLQIIPETEGVWNCCLNEVYYLLSNLILVSQITLRAS